MDTELIIQKVCETRKEEKISDTEKHINNIREKINTIISELKIRGQNHDASKLEGLELEYFTKYSPILKKLEYGSEEYQESLRKLKPALDHHYKNNRHHPEYHDGNCGNMNLVDIIEMFCDWVAASERTKNGDPKESINISCKRFKINDQLKRIFLNTMEILNDTKKKKINRENN